MIPKNTRDTEAVERMLECDNKSVDIECAERSGRLVAKDGILIRILD